jgi:predicted ATPase
LIAQPFKKQRQIHHRSVAQALAADPDTRIKPEFLAHHFQEGGLPREALEYWEKAGRRAFEQSANAEAGGHFFHALELLGCVVDEDERTRKELASERRLRRTP